MKKKDLKAYMDELKSSTGRKINLVCEPSCSYHPHSAQINNPKDAAIIFKEMFEMQDIYEECYMLLLNRANRVIGHVQVSKGGTSATVMDSKIITIYAVLSLASGVIICHNHPSGNPLPSECDRSLTAAVKKALDVFDIALVDHIIVTPSTKRFFSFDNEIVYYM